MNTKRNRRSGEPMAGAGDERTPSARHLSGGLVQLGAVADSFRMSKGQLAATAGLSRETVYKADRAMAPKAQNRVREMLEIIARISDWAGGDDPAMAWYRSHPLPEFGGRTAESLVKTGMAAEVRDYLDYIALGNFS